MIDPKKILWNILDKLDKINNIIFHDIKKNYLHFRRIPKHATTGVNKVAKWTVSQH